MEKFIKELLKQGFEKLFDLDKLRFNKIVISKDVIDECLDYARASHPKEFLAFLDGKIENNTLLLNELLYHQYEATSQSATPIFHFNYTRFYGSIHSHPSSNNKPSTMDLRFFRKLGIVHCIIAYPYTIDSIKFYNHNGEEIMIEIS